MARAPHQYALRFPPIPVINKPHLIHHDGRWKLFPNRWKAKFTDRRNHAACISGVTLTELQARMVRSHDSYRYMMK